MEIHKSKPIHSWREFLKEYAIIVLGVLTALAAEQTAEALHHRAQVEDITEKLQEESRANLEVVDYDIAKANAVVARLEGDIRQVSNPGAQTGSTTPDPLITGILRPGDAAWLAIQYSGLLPIMPKLVIANYWKVDRTNEFLAERSIRFNEAYLEALAALQAYHASGENPSSREQVLLRLANAKNLGHSYISVARSFRAENEWALAGKEIDLKLARRVYPAPASTK